jgi:ABC-type oligopeptide transport system substrate-binding subunit
MKKRFDITYFFIFSACFFFTACIFKRSEKISPQNLRVGFLISQLSNKDTYCENSPCLEVQNLTREGLFRLRYQNNQILPEPTMAESWSFSKDGTLTIVLKKNLKTSKGISISAVDFLKRWENTLSSKNIKEARFLFPIQNARAFFERQVPFSKVGIKILDPQSLYLTFSKPAPDFIPYLCHPSTWLPENGTTQYGSVGPFIEVPSTEPHKVKLFRNPHYLGKQPFFESIELIQFLDPRAARNAFDDKEVNLLSGAIPGLPETAKVFLPSPTKYFLNFTKNNPPYNNSFFKKALTYAIDKTEWINLLHLNVILISEIDNQFERDPQPNTFFNPKKAKEFLFTFNEEKRGNSKLKIAEELPVTLLYPLELESIATNLKIQWLKNLGLQVEIVPKPKETHLLRHSSPTWDIELSSINLYPQSKLLMTDSYFPLFSGVQIIYDNSKLKGVKSNPFGGLDLFQVGF